MCMQIHVNEAWFKVDTWALWHLLASGNITLNEYSTAAALSDVDIICQV